MPDDRTPSPLMQGMAEEPFELIDVDDDKVNPDAAEMASMGRSPTPVNPPTPALTRDPSRAESIARISPKKDRNSERSSESDHSDSGKSVASSPKATGEPKKKQLFEDEEGGKPKRVVQLAFVLDCTGSMQPCIDSAKETILKTAERVQQKCNARVEFGGVVYRDIPPQDRTFVTRSFPFTEDKQAFRDFIHRQRAGGGGDGPEAVGSALHKARYLNWKRSTKPTPPLSKADTLHGVIESVADDQEDTTQRFPDVSLPTELNESAQDVTRILVFITDAPPHGIGIAGDGFPQGEPVWEAKDGQTVGYDPIEEMEELCKMDITAHFVLAEHTPCSITRSFYNTTASMSQGRAVRLADATDIVELVASSAVEACQMDDLADELTSMMKKLGQDKPDMSKEEVKEQAFRSLAAKEPVVTQITCSELNDDTCVHFRSCATLQEMRVKSADVPSLIRESMYHTFPEREDDEEEEDDDALSTPPMALRSFGAIHSETVKYRGLSAATAIDRMDDEDEMPVYRCGASGKRGMVIHEATRTPRAPPPSPAMRVRSYDAAISKDQMTSLLSRVKA